jgi:hypothetical protein
MKIRSGFVSNSSSSSFLIYGIYFKSSLSLINSVKDKEDFKKYLLKQYKGLYSKEEIEDFIKSGNKYLNDINYVLKDYLGVEIYSTDDSNRLYCGISWDDVGDNQTGLDFKNDIKSKLNEKLINLDDNMFKTLSAVWFNG